MSLMTETRDATLPPDAISDELAPTITELGLEDSCRHLVEAGYAVIENVSTPETATSVTFSTGVDIPIIAYTDMSDKSRRPRRISVNYGSKFALP